ncbi:MAG: TIGR01777 family oxidoreductase [Rhizomicrobium sp.]
MTSTLLWTLIAAQVALGGFDTLYHHELTERLAWRPSQRRELKLHGVRNLIYGALFAALGWSEVHGALAWAAIAFLAVEIVITLADFVEEDVSRKLPATERVTHTLLALNYGAILYALLPVLLGWAGQETGMVPAFHGAWSVLAAAAALGVAVFGLRDLAASARAARLVPKPAAALVTALPRHRSILVTGATGFVGARLVEGLTAAGHDVIVLTRKAEKALALRPPFRLVTDLEQIDGATRIDAIVNLAGEPVSGGLWTAARKRAIVESRRSMVAGLLRLAARLEQRPAVLVGASAIGWYGLRGDEELAEDAAPARDFFSHDSCEIVERETAKARGLGLRVVALRIGLVLGTEGGLLARLLLPFEFGMGGRIGSGRQWMSWIARDDLVRLIAHAIANEELEGPVNATAPAPVRNADFARALGHALHRPAAMPLPALPLRLLGAFGRELLLGGQRVVPRKALASGFAFAYPTLAMALESMLGAKPAREHVARAEAAHRLRLG